MKWFLFFVLLFIAILLESTVTTLPVVLCVLFCFGIMLRNPSILFWGFIGGIIIDALSFHTMGVSSLFFLLFFMIVFLYERKFEIQSIAFVFLFSLLGSLLYLCMLGMHTIIASSIVSACMSTGMYVLLRSLNRKEA